MEDIAVTVNHGTRPGVFRWIAFAFGARLPERNREWLLFDSTTPTWALRHVARAMTQLAVPIVLVATLTPGATWIRVAMIVGGTVMGLIYNVSYMFESTDARLVKAGYPSGCAERIRADRARAIRQVQTAARRERIAARQARRGW